MKMRNLATLTAMMLAATLVACGQQSPTAQQSADKAKDSMSKAADATKDAAKASMEAAKDATKDAADSAKAAAARRPKRRRTPRRPPATRRRTPRRRPRTPPRKRRTRPRWPRRKPPTKPRKRRRSSRPQRAKVSLAAGGRSHDTFARSTLGYYAKSSGRTFAFRVVSPSRDTPNGARTPARRLEFAPMDDAPVMHVESAAGPAPARDPRKAEFEANKLRKRLRRQVGAAIADYAMIEARRPRHGLPVGRQGQLRDARHPAVARRARAGAVRHRRGQPRPEAAGLPGRRAARATCARAACRSASPSRTPTAWSSASSRTAPRCARSARGCAAACSIASPASSARPRSRSAIIATTSSRRSS